jgi:FkbM family methyltransferase
MVAEASDTLRHLASRIGVRRRPAPAEPSTPAARRAFLGQARRFTPYVAVELDELLFFVSTADRLGRGLFTYRRRRDLAVLPRALALLAQHGIDPSGSTLVEVGANIGTTTVCALRRHGFGHVVAVEPAPANFRMLGLNLLTNDVASHVDAIEAAVSDREGSATLHVSSRSSGLHAIAAGDEENCETVEVATTTLDRLARDGRFAPEAVGLLWVDAAGGEAPALAGAATLVGRGTPVVTAVRPNLADWERTKAELTRLLAGYTRFADLLDEEPAVSQDLSAVLDAFERPSDLLAFRG